MIGAIQSALSGLLAASTRAQASADNIANLTTEGSLEPGGQPPYSTLTTVQQTVTDGQGNVEGVTASNVPLSPGFVPAYDPSSPFANSDGLVGVPNTNLATEIVNLTVAKTTYAANAKTIQAASAMEDDLMKMFDKKV